jgi:hypothetical protein
MQSDLQNSIKHLLSLAATHRSHQEAIKRATGEHYNVFKILGIGHYEVRTHSPMLGDLLNRNGTHGQGDAFLRLFVERMGITDFDTASAKLELEHHIGAVTEKSGGRIDIVIWDGKGHTIFIENKIYAADQEKQLQRYRDRNSEADIYYLTLLGGMPNGFNEQKLKEFGVTRISYATDIRDWLIACQQEATSLPHVRETISQYLYLIRELTSQSTTQAMNKELIENITGNSANLAAFFALNAEVDNVKTALIAKLDDQLDAIAKDAGLWRDGRIQDLHVKESGIYFKTDKLDKHNLRIGFCFDGRGFQDFDFGFLKKNKDIDCTFAEPLLEAFREQFPNFSSKVSEWWPAWADFEHPYGYWGDEAFLAIQSGDLAASMQDKLVKMAGIADEVCPD